MALQRIDLRDWRGAKSGFRARSPFALILLAASALGLHSIHAQSGASVYGFVADESGLPVRGAAAELVRVAGAKISFTPPIVITDVYGGYQFTALPTGVYHICPAIPGSDLLNPCEWFPNPPAVFLSAGQLRSDAPKIVMKRGKYLNIYVEDPEGKLKLGTKASPDNFVSVRVSSPGGNIHTAASIGQRPRRTESRSGGPGRGAADDRRSKSNSGSQHGTRRGQYQPHSGGLRGSDSHCRPALLSTEPFRSAKANPLHRSLEGQLTRCGKCTSVHQSPLRPQW